MGALGADWTQWRYGRLNTSVLPHMFVPAFSLPEVERPGGFNTVNATGANTDMPIAHVWTIENGLATRVHFCIDNPTMLSALETL